MMFRTPTLVAVAAVAALAAGLIGAGATALIFDDNSAPPSATTTVVQSSAPTGAASTGPGLSVAEIYRRMGSGVVEITVNTGGQFGGGGQAQGSGWVYDAEGHIVTNDHVVDGATSIR